MRLLKQVSKSINNRNGLPKGYTEVEYIASSGNAEFLNTGVLPTYNTGVDIGFYITGRGSGGSQSDSIIIMSGGDSAGYRWGISYRNAGDTLQISGICKTGVSWENVGMSANNYHSVKYNYTNNKDCYLDGTLVRSEIPGGDATIDYPVYLFASNMSGTVWRTGAFRVYYCKITENGNLIRDYIPALDPDGKPCLFDLVTMTPYYNGATTGNDFTYGKKIYGVEYLESSTTKARISTGILLDTFPFTAKVSVSSKAEYNSFFQVIIGTTQGTNQYLIGLKSGDPDFTMKYNNVAKTVGVVPIADKKYEISTTLTATNMTMNIDGTNYSYTQALTANNEEIGLFPQNYNASPMRIYNAQLIKNNTIVRDYIPTRDENNVGYMLDKVTHTLYENKGTETFTLGKDNDTYFNTPKVSIIEEYEGELPKKYKRVEYLEATGVQCIDTGLLSTSSSKVDVLYSFTSMESGAVNNCAIFGGRNNTTSTTFTLFKLASTTPQYFRFDYNSQKQIGDSNNMTWDATSKYRFTYDGTKCTSINISTGETANSTLGPSSTYTTSSIHLFCVNTNGGKDQFMKGRIYHYWYTDGTNTIDLIPCIDITGKPCMYDKIEGKPYYNIKTGDDFIAGPVIKEVEYIDNETASGAPTAPFTFIDEKLTTTTDFEIKFSTIGSNSASWFIGQPVWEGIHYKADSGNKYIGVANYASDANRYYVSYTDGDVITIKTQGSDIYVNETKVGSITRRDATQELLGIFCYKDTAQASPGMRLIGKLYYLNIWDNGKQIREIVPALVNGEYAFWDKITNTVYRNQQADTAFTGALPKSYFRTRVLKEETDNISGFYEKVEYIESTGTQYIDTDYKPVPATTKFELSFKPTDASGSVFMFGSRPDTSIGGTTCTAYLSGNQLRRDWAGNSGYFTLQVNVTDKFVYTALDNTITLNDESFTGTTTRLTTRLNDNFLLFTVNTAGTADSRMFKGKIYSAKLWDNNQLVRDFIPVIRKSDDKPGMYDKVTRTFFTNAGTGEFLYKKKSNEEYTAVNYIESNGTQYIDTGFAFVTSTDEIELEYQNTSTANNKWMFGSYETNANIGISSATVPAPTFWYKGNVTGTQEQQYNSKHKLVYDVYGMTNDGINLKAYSAYTGTWNIYLFALNNDGTSPKGYFGYGKIYSYKHKRNGVTLIDLVPAIRNSDDKPGMYDKVTGTFFTNIGTNEFTYG